MRIVGILLCVLMINFTAPQIALAETIGAKIPHMLDLKDQSGQQKNFDALKGNNGLVLVFVRSVDWCPYCQQQLIALGEAADQITQKGYNIASVSYDNVDAQKKFSDKYGFGFPLLSDPNSDAIAAFGILNEEAKGRAAGVPHPAIYIIDLNGIIIDILKEDGYKSRPPVRDILSVISK